MVTAVVVLVCVAPVSEGSAVTVERATWDRSEFEELPAEVLSLSTEGMRHGVDETEARACELIIGFVCQLRREAERIRV